MNPRPVAWVACYGLLVVLGALGIWTLLQLRTAASDLALRFAGGPLSWGAVDLASFFAMGLAGLLALVFLEHHLRTGLQQDRLGRRALRVLLVELLLLGLAYLVQALATLW